MDRLPHCTPNAFSVHSLMCDRDGTFCSLASTHVGPCSPHGSPTAAYAAARESTAYGATDDAIVAMLRKETDERIRIALDPFLREVAASPEHRLVVFDAAQDTLGTYLAAWPLLPNPNKADPPQEPTDA